MYILSKTKLSYCLDIFKSLSLQIISNLQTFRSASSAFKRINKSSQPQASGITPVTNNPLAALKTQNGNYRRQQLERNADSNRSDTSHGIL